MNTAQNPLEIEEYLSHLLVRNDEYLHFQILHFASTESTVQKRSLHYQT